MNEEAVAQQLKDSGIDMIISLPCDKNKRFTDYIHTCFDVIDVTREEDGVGICAGAYLAGKKPVISIQSSGLGNMMNAIMSLTDCYKLPLVVLASWRGVDDEKIEAQKPFNLRIPQLLDCYGINCVDIGCDEDISLISKSIDDTYKNSEMTVILIRPKLWGGAARMECVYPDRSHKVSMIYEENVPTPTITRLEAIDAVMNSISQEDVVVSNIGVPSKEVFACGDRDLNFYMLGSYTQATPIGFGLALSSKRRIVVIDGDGSLLGSSIFPVLAQYRPDNLTVICMDNGTFGSTGNQTNPSYSSVDMAMVATGYGLPVFSAHNKEEISKSIKKEGFNFIRAMILPGNSNSSNLTMKAIEIRDRFMKSI